MSTGCGRWSSRSKAADCFFATEDPEFSEGGQVEEIAASGCSLSGQVRPAVPGDFCGMLTCFRWTLQGLNEGCFCEGFAELRGVNGCLGAR